MSKTTHRQKTGIMEDWEDRKDKRLEEWNHGRMGLHKERKIGMMEEWKEKKGEYWNTGTMEQEKTGIMED